MSVSDNVSRRLFRGFIQVHILHHAATERVYGAALIDELARHGYRLSPGTLYPILHALERDGFLTRRERTVAGKVRKEYAITPAGRAVLRDARAKLRELVEEVLAGDSPKARRARPR